MEYDGTNFQKESALRGLVAAAIRESREEEPVGNPFEGQFETRGSRTRYLDKLTDTLRHSDALYVLGDLLNV